eukprot:3381611-Rhodomonas_salina.3
MAMSAGTSRTFCRCCSLSRSFSLAWYHHHTLAQYRTPHGTIHQLSTAQMYLNSYVSIAPDLG